MRARWGPFLVLTVCIALLGSAQMARAARDGALPYIEVAGHGSAEAVPDEATFSAGVQARAVQAKDALAQANEVVRRLIEQLKGAGVAERDLSTTSFNVRPIYERNRNNETNRITGYQVDNQLLVRVRDGDRLGGLLDLAIEAGANQVNQVRFTVSDPVAAHGVARAQAMADARRRADQLASLAGVKVSGVRIIEELGNGGGGPPAQMALQMRSADSVPVAAGAQSFSVRLRVRFDIKVK
jgi:uncharacterized protein YggE